jgi:hypothetical protein
VKEIVGCLWMKERWLDFKLRRERMVRGNIRIINDRQVRKGCIPVVVVVTGES